MQRLRGSDDDGGVCGVGTDVGGQEESKQRSVPTPQQRDSWQGNTTLDGNSQTRTERPSSLTRLRR